MCQKEYFSISLIVFDSSLLINLMIENQNTAPNNLTPKNTSTERIINFPNNSAPSWLLENKVALSILSHDLDLWESEAIVLALESNVNDILMDEHKGRRIAIAKGLHPIGTIGVLIQSKKKGLLKSIKPLLDKLIQNNIYISEELYNYSLKLTNEIWKSIADINSDWIITKNNCTVTLRRTGLGKAVLPGKQVSVKLGLIKNPADINAKHLVEVEIRFSAKKQAGAKRVEIGFK